jgi:hypothetical protein
MAVVILLVEEGFEFELNLSRTVIHAVYALRKVESQIKEASVRTYGLDVRQL